MRTLLSKAAAKAWVAALVAFLGPISFLVQSTDNLTERAIITAVVSGLVAMLGTFSTPNATPFLGDNRKRRP